MAKKIQPDNTPVESSLVLPVEKFVDELTKLIQKGKEIKNMNVALENQGKIPYGGYGMFSAPGRADRVRYNEEQQKKFIQEYNRWDSYVKEFLKKSFEHPNNVYLNEYTQNEWTLWGTDIIKEYRDTIDRKNTALLALIDKSPLLTPTQQTPASATTVTSKSQNNNIFIVHGHDGEMKHHVARVLRELGLNPIILHEQPDESRTIIEKLEYYGDKASYAVVLLTADDSFIRETKSSDGKNEQIEVKRARQNVVFEMGYFMAKYGRNHVFIIRDNEAEKVGDIDGVIFSETNSQIWIMKLTRELQNAGYSVDANKALYLV